MVDVVSLGPLALPPLLLAAVVGFGAGGVVLSFQRKQHPDDAAAIQRFTDRVVTAILVAFVLWKLYPLIPWWSQILEDPVRLLRLPGGRPGLIIGAIGFAGLTIPMLVRTPSLLRPAAVALFAVVIGGAVTLAAVQAGTTDDPIVTGDDLFAVQAPTLVLPDTPTAIVPPDTPAVITFWATWCGPCRAEIPVKRAAYERLAPDVAVVSVNLTATEADVATVGAYTERHGLPYPVFLDSDGRLSSQFAVRGTPTTIVTDANGEVTSRWVGPSSLDRIVRAVEDALR